MSQENILGLVYHYAAFGEGQNQQRLGGRQQSWNSGLGSTRVQVIGGLSGSPCVILVSGVP
jgi:hypothetical protein